MTERCKWKPKEVATKCAQQAQLFPQYGSKIEPRVGAAVINTVTTGAPMLLESLRLSADSTGDKLTLTQAQYQQRQDAADLLIACRHAISKAYGKTDPTRLEFGVGQDLNSSSLESIAAGLERFVTAGEAHPEKLPKAAISTDDVVKMKAMRTALESMKVARDAKTTDAKAATNSRNNLQLGIESAMTMVVTAATLAYKDQPDVVALFKSTLPKAHRHASKADDDKTPEAPEDTEPK